MRLPKYLQIEPVGQCNLRCTMCPIRFRRDGPPYGPPAFMDFDKFVRIVDEFVGLEILHLQGLGEPMMHPRFFEMVSYAANKGIRVTTNSNLTLVSQRKAEECVTSGLDALYVSIDGASPETFERIRVRAKLERVLQNVVAVRDARARLQSDTPHLHMVVVVMRQNLDELPDLVRLAHRLSVESVFVQQLSHDFGERGLPSQYKPMIRFVDEQSLRSEPLHRVEEVFAETRKLAQELGVSLRLPHTGTRPYAADTPGRERCDWPFERAYVTYDGRALPCCVTSTPDRADFGDVTAPGSVQKVWRSEKLRVFRERLSSGDPPEVCRSCSVYHGTF